MLLIVALKWTLQLTFRLGTVNAGLFFRPLFYWWCSINLLWYDYISSGGSGDPAGTALPACGAPATLWMVGNGCAERARISSCRKSRLREPKTTGRQREAITFVLTFLISTVQKWVTAAKDTSNIVWDVWVSGISDGPSSARCQHRSPISKPTVF